MNLTQALQKTKDHIRIGKGMELTNQVPEALEMVVEELEKYKEQAEITSLMLKTSFTEQEIEYAYNKVIEVYRKCKAGEQHG